MASSQIISHHRKNLIDKASKYPNLTTFIARVQSTPDDEFLETFGILLMNKQVDSTLEMLNTVASHQPLYTTTSVGDEHHGSHLSPFETASKKNKDWFKTNGNSAKITDGIRERFAALSTSNQSLCVFIKNTVKDHYDLELSDVITHQIESFALNHEINLIHFDIERLCDVMLEGMNSDPQWCIDNILNKHIIDLNDKTSFFNTFIDNKLYSNYGNIVDMEGADYWNHSNKELMNNALNVGDIFVLISDTMHAAFSQCVYIMDYGNKLRRIGIKKYGSYHGDLHLIIPVHITRSLYDPIQSYSALIHQHTYEDGGTVELELQIDHHSHVFDPHYKTLSKEEEKNLIKTYKWKQTHHDGGIKNRRKDLVKHRIINEYNRYNFSTVYVVTDMGYSGSLIGYCNHSSVDKINLSKYTDNAKRKGNGYVVHYSEQKESQEKVFSDTTFDLLLSGFWRNNRMSCIHIPFAIIATIQCWVQQQLQWECNQGITIRKGTSIRYTAKSTDPHEVDELDRYRRGLYGGFAMESSSEEFDQETYDDRLSWLYATSLTAFKKDVFKLDVSIRRDNGGICMGVIDTKNIYKMNDFSPIIMDRKLSTFCYRTTGEFTLNGEKQSKDIKDMSGTTNVIRLILDFNQGKLLWIKKTRTKSRDGTRKLNIVQQREFPIATDTAYKFFVGMCWKHDCVVATCS